MRTAAEIVTLLMAAVIILNYYVGLFNMWIIALLLITAIILFLMTLVKKYNKRN